MQNIGLFGGTFDPIHNGHLQIAESIIEQLKFQQIIFIPNNIPPHRDQPGASAEQRAYMLNLALKNSNLAKLTVDLIELKRLGKSYTIDTVLDFKNKYPDATLWLIIGLDAFSDLHHWHNYELLTQSCNFLIINRELKNVTPSEWSKEYLKQKQIFNFNEYSTQKEFGYVYMSDIDLIDISASYIRTLLKDVYNNPVQANQALSQLNKLLSKDVLDYIIKNRLYSQ